MARGEVHDGLDPLAILRQPDLRTHLTSGRALVLLETDLETVIWANPAGARLMGASKASDLNEGVPTTGATLLRQAASAGRRALAKDHAVEATVRTRRDFRSHLLPVELTPLAPGVLLSADEGEAGDADAALTDLTADMSDENDAAVLLDGRGAVVGSAEDIAAMGVAKDAFGDAIAAGDEAVVAGKDGRHDVRLVQVGDDPVRYLALVRREASPVVQEDAGEPAPRRWFYRARKDAIPETDMEEHVTTEDADPVALLTIDPEAADETASREAASEAVEDRAEEEAKPEVATDEETEPNDGGKPSVGFLAAATGVAATALGAAGIVKEVRKANAEAPSEPLSERPEDQADEEDRDDLLALDGANADDLAAAEEHDEDEAVDEGRVRSGSVFADTRSDFVGAALYAPPANRTAKATADAEVTDIKPEPAADADTGSAFRFERSDRATRFVWSVDEERRFTSVSSALAEAVGPRFADLEGERWETAAERLGIDEGGAIAALLAGGDTWSGRTVLWPVEGENLRVPVDLAGLPAFDRDRVFTGFNGFGIVRTADAVPDNRPVGSQDEEPGEQDEAEVVTGGVRPPAGGMLSEDEQDAFEEIGEQLSSASADAEEEAGETDALDFEPPEADELIAELATPGDGKKDDTDPDEAGEPIGNVFANGDASTAPAEPDERRIEVAEVRDVDTSILARLPIPVLAYRGDTLLFANSEFAELTGYASLHELADAGGVDALFGEHRDENDLEGARIIHREGRDLPVEAHLQTVPWDNERAMLLTLKHEDGGDGGDGPPSPSSTPPSPASLGPASDAGAAGASPAGRGKRAKRLWGSVRGDGPRSDAQEAGATAHPLAALSVPALHDILDTATEGVLVLNERGHVRALNRPAEALFGIDAHAIVGEPFLRLLAPESHRSALDYLSGLTGPGVASILNDGREVIARVGADLAGAEDRGLLPLTMTLGEIHRDDGRDGDEPEERLFCAVLRDITQWKKTEEDLVNARGEAERANREKSALLATVSHEVRTPLNAIIGFSEMMVEERFGPLGGERYHGYARDIRNSGRHVLEIVNDLLDISRIEAGEMPLDFDSVALNTVVTETVAMSQAEANKERIVIRTSLTADLPQVVADERSMRQVVLNLLSNAMRYTRAGGQVIVSTAYQPTGEGAGDVLLRVRDTGVGMDAEQLEEALKPFRQVPQGNSGHERGERGGTGLGLPLTKALVEANRAHFHIASVPQEGTLVEMRFPPQRVLTH